MNSPNKYAAVTALLILGAVGAGAAQPEEWTAPVDVRHDDSLCVSYQAKWNGPYLVVRATVATGWHTFAMDNQKRAEEKLAGKPALSMDKSTEILPAGGLEIAGGWYQSPPTDFSRPELRWFSWGFDKQALFVTKVRRTGGSPAHLTIRGQACTDSICKNINVALSLPAPGDGSGSTEPDWKNLMPVR